MANITICTNCGKAYEAGSSEEPNEATRYCSSCWKQGWTEDKLLRWNIYDPCRTMIIKNQAPERTRS